MFVNLSIDEKSLKSLDSYVNTVSKNVDIENLLSRNAF